MAFEKKASLESVRKTKRQFGILVDVCLCAIVGLIIVSAVYGGWTAHTTEGSAFLTIVSAISLLVGVCLVISIIMYFLESARYNNMKKTKNESLKAENVMNDSVSPQPNEPYGIVAGSIGSSVVAEKSRDKTIGFSVGSILFALPTFLALLTAISPNCRNSSGCSAIGFAFMFTFPLNIVALVLFGRAVKHLRGVKEAHAPRVFVIFAAIVNFSIGIWLVIAAIVSNFH